MWSGTPPSRAMAATRSRYLIGSGWPAEWACVFSRMTRRVMGSWRSSGSRNAPRSRRVQRPIRALAECTDRRADDHRWLPASSITVWVVSPAMASWPLGRCAISLTRLPIVPLANEQTGLLAQQRGRPGLQLVDGGIVTEDVVADAGRGHRAAHRRGGGGDGVGAGIDHGGHGRASIARVRRGPVGRAARSPLPIYNPGTESARKCAGQALAALHEARRSRRPRAALPPRAAQNMLPVMRIPAMNPDHGRARSSPPGRAWPRGESGRAHLSSSC